MKLALFFFLALVVLGSNACGGPAGIQPAAQNGIVGRWRSVDGSYNVEFLANGNCTARMRLQGRDLGGPCTYTVNRDTINIRYPGIEGSDASATWHYSLSGDTLTVAVFGNSLTLQRVR